jgi:hypothetical protein
MTTKKICALFSLAAACLWASASLSAQHSNEFFNRGAAVTIQAGGEVYIQGDMHHIGATGSINNNGLIELQGNAYSDNLFQQRGTGTTRIYNRTVNLAETQTIQGSYAVRGGQAQIGVNDGSFYNLELANRMGAVYLDGVGFVADVRNSVNFDPAANPSPANYIITHPFSSPANGSAYSAIFGIMNANSGLGAMVNNTISANGFISGIDNGYIQGKLRRAVVAAGGAYGFPMGLRPGAPVAEGVQYTELTFAANSYDYITGYFEKGSDNTIPGAPVQCGYNIDWFSGTVHGEWVFTRGNAAGTGTYALTIFPQDYPTPAYSSYFITKDNAIAGTANQCGPNPVGLSRGGFTSFSEFAFASGDVILDAEFISLKATPTDNQYIKLSWNTERETDVFMYELERSLDGIIFDYIGDAMPLNLANNNYSIDDRQVAKNINYYYRVKTIDQDGSYNYTPTVVASLQDKNSNFGGLRLFPNPTSTGNFTVEFDSQNAEPLDIKIYDALGRIIHSQSAEVQTGNNRFELSLQDWAAGMYYVQLSNANFTTTKELVKAQ